MADDLAEVSERPAEMNRRAKDYMGRLFPYGEDGVCHTAFGDLTYSVEVDEKSELHLRMDLKPLPYGSQKSRAQPHEIATPEDEEIASFEKNEGEFYIDRGCNVKTTLEAMNLIDSTRNTFLEFCWGMKRGYEEDLREREEKRNPSLALMKEVARKTMKQICYKEDS